MEQLIAIVNETGFVKSSIVGVLLMLLFGFILVSAVKTLGGKSQAIPQNPLVRMISNVVFSLVASLLVMTVLGSINEGLGWLTLFGSPLIFGLILFLVFKSQEKETGA